MKILLIIVTLIITSWSAPGASHPFFVSVIEVQYLPKENVLGIACKIFSDDLENTLRKYSGQKIDILNGSQERNNAVLEKYFREHLRIQVNGKGSVLRFLGYKNDQEATFVFLEAGGTGVPKELRIITDLLYDLDKRQTNLVHYLTEGGRSSQRLNHPDSIARFTIK